MSVFPSSTSKKAWDDPPIESSENIRFPEVANELRNTNHTAKAWDVPPIESSEDIRSPEVANELPNSNHAAEALRGFKEASGLRKTSDEISQYISEANKPDPGRKTALLRWQVARFTESRASRVFIIVLVVVNALLMWIQADYGTQSNEWLLVESTFVVVFTLEVALKLFGFGFLFFREHWNIIDFTIVVASLVELVVVLAAGNSSTSAISTVRLLRVFRVIRMLSFLERLALLVRAFFLACLDVVWVLMLVIVFLYIFSIMANSFFNTEELKQKSGIDIERKFGTVPRTLVTMFQVMTGDGWYTAVAGPISKGYPGSELFFVFFVLVGTFGMLNLLTAIFIDSLSALNKEGAEADMQRKDDNKKILFAALKQVFSECDVDNSGDLEKDELEEAMKLFQSDAYREAFWSVGLDVSMLDTMLKYADSDLDGKVDFEEFVNGLNEMDAAPVKSDLWSLTTRLNTLQEDVNEHRNETVALRKEVASLCTKIDSLLLKR